MRIRAIFFGMVSVVAVGLWSAIQGPGDRLVAASYDKASSTAYTSISDDQGRTWRRQTVPPQDLAAPLEELRLVASPTAQTCGCSGTGRSRRAAWAAPRHVRKNVGLPVIWRFHGDRWTSKGTVDRLAPRPMETYSVAPIGGGLIAVAGPHGLALVDDGWRMASFFPRVEWVGTLPDGTVIGSAAFGNASVYLGQRSGRAVRLTQVALDR